MKPYPPRLFYSFMIVFAMGIFFSCTKTEDALRPSAEATTAETEQKFFTQHRSNDAVENALVNYIKQQNNQLHFVEKTVSRIGYPRWNKAIAIKSKSPGISGRETTGSDSSTFYYIPFVRDSQNYVNASMVIAASATDTSFGYYCDWQYRQLSNSTSNHVDEAEQMALFFMKLDNEVFGHKKFIITDTSLFDKNGNIAGKVQFDSIQPGTNNLTYVLTCEDIAVSVWEHCDFRQINNQLPTESSVPMCQATYWVYICWYELDFGSPETGGGGGGGNGSGGGGTPPDCGGPEGRIAARGDLPCEEEPGWEPEIPELPFDDYNPLIADTIIIDTSISNNFPCSYNLLTSLPNINSFTQVVLHNTFNTNTNVNLNFKIDASLGKNDEDAYYVTQFYSIDSSKSPAVFKFSGTIFLNPWVLRNSTKEYVIATFVHEPLHAFIQHTYYQYSLGIIDSATVKQMFPIFWDFFANTSTPNQPMPPTTEHNIMASQYVSSLSQTIKLLYSGNAPNQNWKDSICNALAWGGLGKTNVWNSLPMQEKCDKAHINLVARDTTLTGTLVQGGGLSCGYNYSNYDSLKLSKPCP